MSELQEYITARLAEIWDETIAYHTCWRDGILSLGYKDDAWCPLCGMHPRAEGPPKPYFQNLRGIHR